MTTPGPGPALLGTRLQHLLELFDSGIAAVYSDLGLDGFRPRFTPVLRVLAAAGPSSIRDVAAAIGVTHSAASQTVAHMVKAELVAITPGNDARQRIVALTARARELLPTLEAEFVATADAAAEFEAQLSFPLSQLIDEAIEALSIRPMRQRILDAAPDLVTPAQAGSRPKRATH
jgi:DNA-binding MarR family transcriptional regulator